MPVGQFNFSVISGVDGILQYTDTQAVFLAVGGGMLAAYDPRFVFTCLFQRWLRLKKD